MEVCVRLVSDVWRVVCLVGVGRLACGLSCVWAVVNTVSSAQGRLEGASWWPQVYMLSNKQVWASSRARHVEVITY